MRALVALCAVVIAAGCAGPSAQPSSSTAATTGDPATAGPGGMRELPCDTMGTREPQDGGVVARDQATYEEAWRRICASTGLSPPDEVPAVDFPREHAVLYAWGTQPAGGYGVEIASVTSGDAGTEVLVRRWSPGASCAMPAVITYPAAAVATAPIPEGEVSWKVEDVVHECD